MYNHADFTGGGGTVAVIVADFNEDGLADLAVANGNDNTVSILLGTLGAGFGAKTDYNVGMYPAALVDGDFNGDGKPDLAVVNQSDNTLSILLGNGDGTFANAVAYSVGADPTAIVSADFNGDGKLDLAVTNDDGSVSLLLGNGDGTLRSGGSVGTTGSAEALAVGDLNSDHKPDLVVTHRSSPNISALLGNGDGTFSRVDSNSGGHCSTIALGDFNKDGLVDIALGSPTGSYCTAGASVSLGKGDGTFGAPVEVAAASDATSIVAQDFNRDGYLDLAIGYSAYSTGVGIYLGNGDGSFKTPLYTSVALGGTGLAAADINGDSYLDLVAVTPSGYFGGISVVIADGDGNFGIINSYPNSATASVSAAVDLNGDGFVDLVSNSVIGGFGALLNDGHGGFGSPVVSLVGNVGPRAIAAGDFNGDGKADLLVNDISENQTGLVTYLGNGDGSFEQPVTTSAQVTDATMAIADFNGDGKLDVAAPGFDDMNNPTTLIFLGRGDGTFQLSGSTGANVGGPFAYVVTGDFNKDGATDLAVLESSVPSSTAYVLLGNGDGTFRPAVPYTLGQNAGCMVAGDFNGNGNIDLAAGTFDGMSVLLGNGDGTFAAAINSGPTIPCNASVAGDFNGDGKLDFLAGYQGGTVGPPLVLLGNGDGTFQAPVGLATGDYADEASLAAADFNGDGTPDLAFAGLYLNDTFVYESSPAIALSPASMSFGTQNVGVTSSAQTLNVSEISNAGLSLESITVNGDFAETNACGDHLGVGAQCQVLVTFTPTSGGTRAGTITITDNAAGSPQVIALSGTGLGPGVGLSPGSLTYGDQLVGTTSASQTETVTNTGNEPLTFSSVSITGDFAGTTTCAGSLAAGESCTVRVTFSPTVSGTRTGTITISDNAYENPQTVGLTGTGVAPVAGVSPSSLSFGNQFVGTANSEQAVALSNTGTAALTISSIALSGANGADFSQTNNCGSSVAAGGSCTINVTFTPSATGARSATLTVNDDSNGVDGSAQTVSLSGTGTAPAASLAPASLSFGNQLVHTVSAAQALTLSNTGKAALTITSIAVSGANGGDFAQTNNCGSSVVAGGSCAISVTFKPAATGTRSGTLTVTDNSNGVSGSAQTASLSGTGVAPAVTLNPATLPAFGNQLVGTASAAQALTLTNSGTAALSITSIALSGANAADFAESNNCGSSVAAGASCAINLTFTPSATGARSATLTLTDNNGGTSGSAQTVALAGTGVAPAASLSPASLSFTNQNVGTASPVKEATITNTGTAALTITSIAVGGTNAGDFSETSTCGGSVGAGGTCTVMVTFKPTAIGSRTSTLTVTDDAAGSPQTAALSGTGLGASATASPASLTYAADLAGSTSAAQTVTITNGGNANLSFTRISASGDFAVAASGTTCSTTSALAAGKKCVVQVTFTPTAGGSRSGSLTLEDDAVGSASQTVGLTGTGEDFTLAAGQGGTTTAVSPGGTATYSVTLTPQGGFTQQISLSCAFAAPQPVGTSCSVSPSTLTPGGSGSATVTVTASTRAGTLPGPRWPTAPRPQEWLWALLLLTALALLASCGPGRRRRVGAGLTALALLAALAVGCGGGSASMMTTPPPPTPSGTYNLTLTATSGTLTQTVGLKLTVQ
ncbi:MAG TPA: choice-of-anchor D domain-containing protein [Terriglobia bacterium]|nr:choice-of-anchor D domain-containing protein [Terriglobia bacterium]